MIFCEQCKKSNDDVVDMGWTLGYKRGRVTNAFCRECGGILVNAWFFIGTILIEEEYE